MSPERRESPLHKIQADAYRAYLKAVREGLDRVDIDALDVRDLPDALWHYPLFCYVFCSYCSYPGQCTGTPIANPPGTQCQ